MPQIVCLNCKPNSLNRGQPYLGSIKLKGLWRQFALTIWVCRMPHWDSCTIHRLATFGPPDIVFVIYCKQLGLFNSFAKKAAWTVEYSVLYKPKQKYQIKPLPVSTVRPTELYIIFLCCSGPTTISSTTFVYSQLSKQTHRFLCLLQNKLHTFNETLLPPPLPPFLFFFPPPPLLPR